MQQTRREKIKQKAITLQEQDDLRGLALKPTSTGKNREELSL